MNEGKSFEHIYSAAGNFIVTPEKLNILIPKTKYDTVKYNRTKHLEVFDNQVSPYSGIASISPTTRDWVKNLIDLPSPIIKKTPKTPDYNQLQLIKTINRQKKLLSKKRLIIKRLQEKNTKRQKLSKINVKNFIQQTPFSSKNSKALVSMQILHKRRQPWTNIERKVAFSIFYKSPSTYKYMRKTILFYQEKGHFKDG